MSLPSSTDVGVIIGRFQVPDLHAGHKKLFEQVLSRHKRVLVFLGIPAWRGGIKNPLDYPTREIMIKYLYPDVTVLPLQDRQTNEEWSRDVDKTIRTVYPFEKVTLYGGRNGFTSKYTGVFPTIETLEDPTLETETGTEIRSQAAALPRYTSDFRAGVIYASFATPSSITICVDGGVIRNVSGQGLQVLLIRKPLEKSWRFPGGRVDPGDVSLAKAAVREVREETGVEVGTPIYIDSRGPIPDWRGEQSGLGIHSALFFLPYIFGAAIAGDDAAEAKWFKLYTLKPEDMESCHRGFITLLQLWCHENDAIIQQYAQGGAKDELSEANG